MLGIIGVNLFSFEFGMLLVFGVLGYVMWFFGYFIVFIVVGLILGLMVE